VLLRGIADRIFSLANTRLYEGENITTAFRAVGAEGTILSSSAATGTSEWVVDNWDLGVYDLDGDDPATAVYSLTAQATATLLQITGQPPTEAALLTDGYWQNAPDTIGYNCRYTIASTNYTQVVGHRFRHVFTLHTADWGALKFTHVVTYVSAMAS